MSSYWVIGKLQRTVQSLYVNGMVSVRVNGGISEWFEVGSQGPQARVYRFAMVVQFVN